MKASISLGGRFVLHLQSLFLATSLSFNLQAATTNVSVGNTFFSPNSITVAVGDTVHWSNTGGTHNVAPTPTGSEPPANSIGGGWTYDHSFNITGAYYYYCQVHGAGSMWGVVNVVSPSYTTTPTPTPTATATQTVLGTFTDTPSITESFTISPTFSESPTFSHTATASPTPTVTPTLSPGSPMIQMFEKAPELLLAPNPLKVGESVCLYSSLAPSESRWDVYNTALERVARLKFSGNGMQCWDTKAVSPGLYYVDILWVLPDARVKRAKQKVVLWR